jgi:hypothetical protein
MAEHSSTFQGPDSVDALLADRQRFWNGFTNATLGGLIFMIVLLVGMAVFLL